MSLFLAKKNANTKLKERSYSFGCFFSDEDCAGTVVVHKRFLSPASDWVVLAV